MTIYPIRAFADNYIWTLVVDKKAVVIDAGEAKPVIKFLKDNDLTLCGILITHHHHDHIGGVSELLCEYPTAQVIAHDEHGVPVTCAVGEGDEFELLGKPVKVWQTAGHTDTHLSYLIQDDDDLHVFCGDTLFSGGCGRVFTGTMQALFDSLNRFATLPDETLFYPAHEYTLSNLTFGLTVCGASHHAPIAQAIQDVQATLAQNKPSLPTTLAKEKQLNVFLQTDDDDLKQHLQQYPHAQTDTPFLVFKSLRELKNQA